MNDAKLRMVKVVLHWAWDPIGVRGVHQAVDEYDGYAARVLEMLESASTDDDVGAYLTHVEGEWMGLKPDRDKNGHVAGLLRELFALMA